MGLSGLLASFLYMNFALLIGQIYVLFRVLNDGFHRGKKSGLMHVVAQGGGGECLLHSFFDVDTDKESCYNPRYETGSTKSL